MNFSIQERQSLIFQTNRFTDYN